MNHFKTGNVSGVAEIHRADGLRHLAVMGDPTAGNGHGKVYGTESLSVLRE